MAASYGFYNVKGLIGDVGKISVDLIIGNSATISVGDMVRNQPGSNNYIALAGAGNNIAGVCEGFIDADGRPGERSPDVSFTAATVPDEFVADSDNATVDKVRGRINVTPYAVWENNPDADIGTTTGSNVFGYHTDIVAASNQVDENTAATGAAQLFILGTKPNDDASGTHGLYYIYESQLLITSA